jgi:hypothetical protein
MTRGIEYHAECVGRWREKYLLAEKSDMADRLPVALASYQIHMVSIAYLINPELFPNMRVLK